jgi:hypothetical protein
MSGPNQDGSAAGLERVGVGQFADIVAKIGVNLPAYQAFSPAIPALYLVPI